MIIDFSLQNFGSVKDKQTLSFEADESNHLEDYYVIENAGFRLLKMGLIYGANASGKTTILKGLNFLKKLVLEPLDKKTQLFEFNPFLFDSETPKQTSKLELNFLQNQVRYHYQVEFTQQAIISESLDSYQPEKTAIFTRTTNLENKLTAIIFDSEIKKDSTDKKTLESNTLWNNTVLGGFLKTNMDFFELKEVIDWFELHLNETILTQTDLTLYITEAITKGKIQKETVVSTLKQADLQVSNIEIEEKDVPESVLEVLQNNSIVPPILMDQLNKRKIKEVRIDITHRVGEKTYHLPLALESQGTQRYYAFAGLLAMLVGGKKIIPIDELESSLHPDLYTHFILSFLVNAKHSQLLATTHNREILNNKDIFRKDAIWFTDKSNGGATELYSLADFEADTVDENTNVLNAYKSGKLGAKPNLGDYYINLED